MLQILLEIFKILQLLSTWIINFIVKNIFSILALAISIFSIWKNRADLTVNFPDHLIVLPDYSIEIVDDKGKYLHAYRNLFLVTIKIINPSPNDIAFYDLKAVDSENNNFLEFVNTKPFKLHYDKSNILFFTNQVTFNILNVPENNYGVFRSNSYSKFDLPIVITDPEEIKHLNYITISFKVAKRPLFKNTDILVYKKKYKVTGWQDNPNKKGYNNAIQIFVISEEILSNSNLSLYIIRDQLQKLKKVLFDLRDFELSEDAFEAIILIFDKLVSYRDDFSDEDRELILNIKNIILKNNNWKIEDNFILKLNTDFGKITFRIA